MRVRQLIHDWLQDTLERGLVKANWGKAALVLAVGAVGWLAMPKDNVEARALEALRFAIQAHACVELAGTEAEDIACNPTARLSIDESRDMIARLPEPQPVLGSPTAPIDAVEGGVESAEAVSFLGIPSVADETDASARRMLAQQTASLAEKDRELAVIRRELTMRDQHLDTLSGQIEALEGERGRLRQSVNAMLTTTETSCDAAVNQAVNETVTSMRRERDEHDASQVCFARSDWDGELDRLVGLCSRAGFSRGG